MNKLILLTLILICACAPYETRDQRIKRLYKELVQEKHRLLQKEKMKNWKDCLEPYIVKIEKIKNGKILENGNGVIINENGIVLTAEHLLRNRKIENLRVTIIEQNIQKRYPFVVLDRDSQMDVAVLKIASHRKIFPFKTLSNQEFPKPDTVTAVIGYLENEITINSGIVGKTMLTIPYKESSSSKTGIKELAFITVLTDQELIPGMSGSPVFTGDGKLVGICSARFNKNISKGMLLFPPMTMYLKFK